MFSSKQLSADQVKSIQAWAEEGSNLSEIQKRITDEFKHLLTYMDTRLLVLDLGITLKEEKKEEIPKPVEAPLEGTGEVTTTMDSIAVPGTIVSGRTTFSDGEQATWMIDQSGRPSLDPNTPGYQPTEEDITSFQTQLRELIKDTGL